MAKFKKSAITAAERMEAEDRAFEAAQFAEQDVAFEAYNRSEYEAQWGYAYEGHRTYRLPQ